MKYVMLKNGELSIITSALPKPPSNIGYFLASMTMSTPTKSQYMTVNDLTRILPPYTTTGMFKDEAKCILALINRAPKTSAERGASFADRQRKAGLVDRKVWATPIEHDHIKFVLAILRARKPKLMICGYGRHGKDTLSNLIDPGFRSSSRAAMDAIVWDSWGFQYYFSKESCYKDRHNHRETWYKIINRYNHNDKARLSKEVFKNGRIYCGMRDKEEFNAAEFDISIWVDAGKRLPPESSDSCTVTPDMCDHVIDNNGTLKDLTTLVESLSWR